MREAAGSAAEGGGGLVVEGWATEEAVDWVVGGLVTEEVGRRWRAREVAGEEAVGWARRRRGWWWAAGEVVVGSAVVVRERDRGLPGTDTLCRGSVLMLLAPS